MNPRGTVTLTSRYNCRHERNETLLPLSEHKEVVQCDL